MVLGNPFEPSSDRKASSHQEGTALPLDRLASHIADLILLLPVMALVMAPFRRAVSEAKLLDNLFDSDWALIQGLLIAAAVGIIWETFFVSMWGTSPGRAIFGLRIVDMWTGEKPRPFHAFLRAIAWWLSVFFLGAPFFGVYGNAKRRPLHDRVADTEVRSRNTRRQSAAPRLSELAMGSLFTTGAVFFATLILLSQLLIVKEHARMADERDHGRMCDEVSTAVEEWEPRDPNPTRISVALGLSAAGIVDSDCLERESEYALWNNHGRVLGYLGKGITRYGHDDDEAAQYFEKVCSLEPDGDSCRIAKWYGRLAQSRESTMADADVVDSLEKIAKSIGPGSPRSSRSVPPEWLRLVVLRELFVQKADPKLILQLTAAPAKHDWIGAKLIEYRARALWWLDRKSDAKETVFASVDALPRTQKLVVTSWLCNRELYESTANSCSEDATRACDLMERSADDRSGDTGAPTFVVAALRYAECGIAKQGPKSITKTFAKLAKDIDEPNGKKLIDALRLLRFENRNKGLQQLRDLAAIEDADDDLFVTEANIRLIEELSSKPGAAVAKELGALRERWLAAQKARRYADWGRTLFDALERRGDWTAAAQVGAVLKNDSEADQTLRNRITKAVSRVGELRVPASASKTGGEP